jgi:hypothetical protein
MTYAEYAELQTLPEEIYRGQSVSSVPIASIELQQVSQKFGTSASFRIPSSGSTSYG